MTAGVLSLDKMVAIVEPDKELFSFLRDDPIKKQHIYRLNTDRLEKGIFHIFDTFLGEDRKESAQLLSAIENNLFPPSNKELNAKYSLSQHSLGHLKFFQVSIPDEYIEKCKTIAAVFSKALINNKGQVLESVDDKGNKITLMILPSESIYAIGALPKL